jgi:hypothetical protein
MDEFAASNCDNKGSTLTVIASDNGHKLELTQVNHGIFQIDTSLMIMQY